jgi:hypothetical protein
MEELFMSLFGKKEEKKEPVPNEGKIVITLTRQPNGQMQIHSQIQTNLVEAYYALSVVRENVLKQSINPDMIMPESTARPDYMG